MQHRRCVPLAVVLMAALMTFRADAGDCGGCLEPGCLGCGPLSGKLLADPYDLSFCERPGCALGSVSLDLVALERSGAASQDIMFVGPNPVVNATDLNFVTELGFRLDLIVPGDCDVDLNINVLGSGHDRAAVTRDDPGIIPIFFGGGPAAPATSYTAEYVSDLISAEVNLRVREWPRLAPLVGFRAIQLDEHYNIWETGTNSRVASNTDNKMFGLQFGLQGLLWRGPRLRLETVFKAGAYYNDLDQRVETLNILLLRDNARTSFAGEVQLTLIYQLGPRLLLRTGYQGIWLGDVGLAPDQSDDGSIGTSVLGLDTGNVSYQGGFLGLELTW